MKSSDENQNTTETILTIDAGNYSAGIGKYNILRTEYLLNGLMKMGYDAINLGYRDFLNGPQYIIEMKKKYKIPFVSANVLLSQAKIL